MRAYPSAGDTRWTEAQERQAAREYEDYQRMCRKLARRDQGYRLILELTGNWDRGVLGPVSALQAITAAVEQFSQDGE
jgi:hypothetical protein